MERQRDDEREVAGDRDQPGGPEQRKITMPQSRDHILTWRPPRLFSSDSGRKYFTGMRRHHPMRDTPRQAHVAAPQAIDPSSSGKTWELPKRGRGWSSRWAIRRG